MSALIPIHHQRNFLFTETLAFSKEHNLAETLDKDIISKVLDFIFVDLIDTYSNWSKNYDRLNAFLIKELPWYIPHTECPVSALYRSMIIDPLIDTVSTTLDTYELVYKNTWDVWSIRVLQNYVILTNEGDYRVLDWQRRMDEGTWV